MKLDALLALATTVVNEIGQRELDNEQEASRYYLARGFLDLFGESQPCGWPEPVVDRGLNPIGITWECLGTKAITPTESRALAAMLIRAADEAERD